MMTAHTITLGQDPGLAFTAMPLPEAWVLAGTPSPRGQVLLRTPDQGVVAGIWECSAGQFRYEHRYDETVRIEAGAVTIAEATGRISTLRPGDFGHFPAGTVSTWTVESFLRKTFFLRTNADQALAIQPAPVVATQRRISLLDGSHADLVNTLRLSQYANAKGFTVKPPGIVWNRSDDQSIILGAWEGDTLVSTLRVEVIETPELVAAKLEGPWAFDMPQRFPAMVLSKMATLKSHRGTGLNEALRHHALTLAHEWQVPHVLGTFIAGSPRQAAMATMGYQFATNLLGWHTSNYQSEQPVLICLLDMAQHGETALEVCRSLAGEALETYTWDGPRPAMQFVTVVR